MSDIHKDTLLQEDAGSDDAIHLPFDIFTILIGLWRRRYIFIAITIVFLGLGILGGLTLGTHSYKAQTVLLYKPPLEDGEIDPDAPSLFTLLQMVKLPSNIAEVRRRLSIPASLSVIGAACSIDIQRKTTLISISVKWNNAEQSAAIANTLRDVFLERQVAIRRRKLEKKIHDLEIGMKLVDEKLQIAEDALHTYVISNRIVDLSKEAEFYLDQLVTLDVLYQKAIAQKETADDQASKVIGLISNLRVRVEQEAKAAAAQMQDVVESNVKIQRLRELIEDDRLRRMNLAGLTQKRLEVERLKRLHEIGAVSRSEYDEALAEYEMQKARTVDTEQIEDWQTEIEKLDKVVAPSNAGATPTGDLLENMMIREFEIRLNQIAANKQVTNLMASVHKVKDKLDYIAQCQREYSMLQRDVKTLEEEKKGVEELLGAARRAKETASTGFILVSEARVPSSPRRSSRKKIVILITGFGIFLGGFIILGLELSDLTIKSPREFEAKCPGYPLLGSLKKVPAGSRILPGKNDSVFIEDFRAIARKIIKKVPQHGARILIVSTVHGEGTTTVAANLAACFGRQDKRTLLIDAHIRPDDDENNSGTHSNILSLIDEPDEDILGLGEYLSFEASEVDDVIHPTLLPGVECIPRVGKAIIPDVLASHRCEEMFEELSQRFSLVLVESPPVTCTVDTETLAKHADAIICVTQTKRCNYLKIKKSLDSLAASGTPVIGAVLTNVDPVYL